MFQNSSSAIEEKARINFTTPGVSCRFSKGAEIINEIKIRFSQFLQFDNNELLRSHSDTRLAIDSFNHLIQKVSAPEAGVLADWFFTLFVSIEEEEFIPAMQSFSRFSDLCFQYDVQHYLAKPNKLPLFFKCSSLDYLEICIAALMGSKNKNVQARLLDQLPPLAVINVAFTNGLSFICDKMTYNNTIQLQTYAELEKIDHYRNYSANVLVYIAMTPLKFSYPKKITQVNEMSIADEVIINERVDFFSCLKFINVLDEMALTQVSLSKKRKLINRFVNSIYRFPESCTAEEFICMIDKLNEINKMDYCEKLFGRQATSIAEKEFNNYIHISQYLMLVRRATR